MHGNSNIKYEYCNLFVLLFLNFLLNYEYYFLNFLLNYEYYFLIFLIKFWVLLF